MGELELSKQVSEVREHFDNLWARNVSIHSEVLLLKLLNMGVAISQSKPQQIHIIRSQLLLLRQRQISVSIEVSFVRVSCPARNAAPEMRRAAARE